MSLDQSVVTTRRHKLLNFLQGRVIYGLTFGHIGKFAMIAVYFILTQWLTGQHVVATIAGRHIDFFLWNVKSWWDHMLSRDIHHGGLVQWLSVPQWNDVRHIVRPYMEGLGAILLYQQIGFDPLKYEAKRKKSPGRIDRLLQHVPLIPSRYKEVTAAQEAAIPFIVLLVGTAIAFPMFWAVLPEYHNFVHWIGAGWLQPHLSAHPSLAEKLYSGSYDAFIMGLVAGFLVRRITRPVFDANMLFFCRQWVARGRNAHWWMPPGMRYAIRALDVQGARERLASGGRWLGVSITFVALVTLALAAYGGYIINVIA